MVKMIDNEWYEFSRRDGYSIRFWVAYTEYLSYMDFRAWLIGEDCKVYDYCPRMGEIYERGTLNSIDLFKGQFRKIDTPTDIDIDKIKNIPIIT